jgi:1-pyrroline-5-carboxylate dehydrogenase
MQSGFTNEMTYYRMVREGREEEFHSRYEDALAGVRSELGGHHPIIIGGETYFSEAGEFEDRSPGDTRILLGYFQKGLRRHAKMAVNAAKEAFLEWGWMDWRKRVDIMRRAGEIMAADKFRLAAIITLENGKNRLEAMADVDEAIDFLRYYSQQVEENRGFRRVMGRAFENERAESVLRPIGVWAVIPPFNFPLAITTGMSSGALVTGNTIVLKPASDTPLIALKYYEILIRAGVPPGAVNYLTGSGPDLGPEFVENMDVAGIAFTGSWDVGSRLYAEFSAKAPRPFIAEMGGKNTTIVTKSADLRKAVEGVIRGAFGYGGQKCSATSRLLLAREIKDVFIKMLLERLPSFKVGDPTSRDTFLGPVINNAAYEKYLKYVDLARREGRILYGGRAIRDGGLEHGYYVEPTVVDEVPLESEIWREELFVPILAVRAFETLEEAIDMANKSEYGLTAGIFTSDLREIEVFFEKIEAGVCYANRTVGSTTGAMVGVQSFGGWKRSGSTGKGAGGPYYLYQFMREQSRSTYT